MVKATSSGNFKAVKLPEPQTTVARCYSMIDIGTVENVYQGVSQGWHRRIMLWWELPLFKAVFVDDKGEQPFAIFEEFTLSTKDNSNFSKLVANWRNKPFTMEEMKGFDPAVMVGKTCVIQFIHRRKGSYKNMDIPADQVTNENTVLKLQAIMKRPKDMAIPEQINPSLIWDWEPIEKGEKQFDKSYFELIPAFVRTKIEQSQQFQKHGIKSDATQAEMQVQEPNEPKDQGPVTEDDW